MMHVVKNHTVTILELAILKSDRTFGDKRTSACYLPPHGRLADNLPLRGCGFLKGCHWSWLAGGQYCMARVWGAIILPLAGHHVRLQREALRSLEVGKNWMLGFASFSGAD